MNQTKQMKPEKQNKKDELILSPETAIKICEIHPRRWGRLRCEGFMGKQLVNNYVFLCTTEQRLRV